MSRAIVLYQRTDTADEAYESIVAELSARYDAANGDFQRSRQSLYHFLAWVYVSASKIDAAHGMKDLLVTDVENLVADTRDCKRRPKYHDRDTLDLLLLLKTRVDPDLASSKCRWLIALKAARSRDTPIPPDEDAFLEWISEFGVDKAAKLGAGSEPFNLAELVNEAVMPGESFTIDLPEEIDSPDGFVVILAQVLSRDRNKATLANTAVFTEGGRVRQLGQSEFKRRRDNDRAIQVEIDKEAKAILKAFKKSDQYDPGAPGMFGVDDVPKEFIAQWRHEQRHGGAGVPITLAND